MLAAAAYALPFGCGNPDIAFELGRGRLVVDTASYGFTVRTVAPIRASGRDAEDDYLLVFSLKAGISMRAGEKPDSGVQVVLLRRGRGEVTAATYESRCTSVGEGDCVSHWKNPEHAIVLVGYIPLRSAPRPSRSAISDSTP
jgi:hypothetical protein